MRNVTTAVSAAITAILIGLLVANISSAARAAEIQHAKNAQIATLQASVGADDALLQLRAYRQRYTETYNQLAAAYRALVERDASYAALWNQSRASGAQLESANAALEARLAQAYQAMQQAQAALAANSPPSGGNQPAVVGAPAPATPAPATPRRALEPGTTVPATAAPVAAPVPAPQPTKTMYCWYDPEGHYVCEDHPRGE